MKKQSFILNIFILLLRGMTNVSFDSFIIFFHPFFHVQIFWLKISFFMRHWVEQGMSMIAIGNCIFFKVKKIKKKTFWKSLQNCRILLLQIYEFFSELFFQNFLVKHFFSSVTSTKSSRNKNLAFFIFIFVKSRISKTM